MSMTMIAKISAGWMLAVITAGAGTSLYDAYLRSSPQPVAPAYTVSLLR